MADNNRSLFGFQFKRKAIETDKKPVSFAADNETVRLKSPHWRILWSVHGPTGR